ncbi:MAG: VWA domain-containing protein [Streptosporangiaceae bacterium]|nr:VWA domain-containing protein [Streptosporangiaceae bacterium]
MPTDIAPLDTEYPAEPEAGLGALATSRGNLPLDAVDVRAAITGTSASVEVTQEFRNPFDVALEAAYIFPLPDRAAVTALRMECAGHVVEAALKERSQARQEYDQAIAEGHRAAIAEEDRPDVFTMRVGNIIPGERVTVRLTLAQPLPYEDGEVTYRFPLVVAPRYIPGRPIGGPPAGGGAASDTDAVPDASRITPPVLLPGFPNPVRLTMSADVDPAGLPLTGIACSLHATLEETAANGHTLIRLRPGERLDRDFILRLTVADRQQITTSLVLTPDGQDEPTQGTFTVTLVPPDGSGRPRPRDVVLVLDRSGSMSGWKMVAARRAAARIVDTLTGTDRFAVLCFDYSIEQPPTLPRDGLAEATDRNRFRAIEHLARTDARGGTEMLTPLEHAIRLLTGAADAQGAHGPTAPAAGDRDRVLILVTDGQVGNEDQILNRIGAALSGVRVHVIGIDRAVNAEFLSRLASAGRGRCELVESEDRLDEAAASIHRRIGAPLVTALTLAADGLEIVPGTVAPSLLPDLFPGVPVTVAGRWRGSPAGTITVRGAATDGTPFDSKITAAVGGTPASTAIWARAHVRDLEDRYACLTGYNTAEMASLEHQITDVSLRYGVLCRFTAFVAVDSRVVTDGKAPHRVTQPVELPSGWEPAALGGPFDVDAETYVRPAPAAAAAPAMPLNAGTPPIAPRGRRAHAASKQAKRAAPMMGMPATPQIPTMSPRAGQLNQLPGDASRLAQVRRQLADEGAALRAAEHAPDSERARLLADLATRIEALLTWLAEGPAPNPLAAGQVTALTELAGKLRECDKPQSPRGAALGSLWEETIRVLTDFTASGNAPDGPPTPASHAFWKRSP